MLCVLIYVRTGCGLRTVISIIRIFEEVIGDPLGKLPCYNSVANWVRKLDYPSMRRMHPKNVSMPT